MRNKYLSIPLKIAVIIWNAKPIGSKTTDRHKAIIKSI